MPRRFPRHDLNSPSDIVPYDDVSIEFGNIEFRTVTRTEIVGEWPRLTKMSVSLLRSSPHILINNKGRIVFRVENGTAIYQLHHMQDSDYALNLELVRAR